MLSDASDASDPSDASDASSLPIEGPDRHLPDRPWFRCEAVARNSEQAAESRAKEEAQPVT